MGSININDQPLFIIKEYKAVYSVNAKSNVSIKRTDLGLEDIPGYKIFGVQQYLPGVLSEQVYALILTDDTCAKIYNYSSDDHSNAQFDIWITWIREDAVSDNA